MSVISNKGPRRVVSTNAGVWAANVMQPENRPPSTAGDATEIAFTLQIGDEVDQLGPVAPNDRGVLFAPVSVRGKTGVFWMRTTSLSPVPAARTSTVAAPVAPAASFWSRPWWHWAVGGAAVAVGATAIALLARSRRGGSKSASAGAREERHRPTAVMRRA